MRKLLAGATMLVFGAGAMSSASAQLQLKGSDTLEDVAKNVLADCIVATADPTVLAATDITYVGGGSGGGQAAMVGGQQRIAPMSRPINGAQCPVTPPATQGVLDARGEQLLIGLDGIAIVAQNQTHVDSLFDDGLGATFNCNDAITATTLSASLITPPGTPVGTPGAGGCPADPALGGAPNCCLDAAGNNFGCNAAGSYVFTTWSDVLALLYAGQNHTTNAALLGTTSKTRNPARINCASPVRKALADNWGTLFNTNCTATGDPLNCVKLKHAFRRGDLSGTTDTFVTLVGLAVAVPAYTTTFLPNPAGLPTVNPATATANPFCNAGPQPMNKGDSDYLDLDPIRRIADSGANPTKVALEQVAEGRALPSTPPVPVGHDSRPDPTASTSLVELADFGSPNRPNVGPNQAITAPAPNDFITLQAAAIAARKGLGLVLPVEMPTNYTDYATAYWGSAAAPTDPTVPPTVCTAGAFAGSIPTGAPANSMCPNGGSAPCLFPVHVNADNSLNFNCLVSQVNLSRPPIVDLRVYNLMVMDPTGHYRPDAYTNPSLTTLSAAKQNRTVSAFFRLNASQSTNLGGPVPAPNGFTAGTTVCKTFTSTDQIGCLVQANPCSIGFVGREAVVKAPLPLNNLAYRLGTALADSRAPTDTTITALLDTSATAPFYPMARKLFVNHWVDPALPVLPTMAKEDVLYNCFKQDAITSPRITQFHFLKVPGGPKVDDACPNNR